jgi:hypothetical protein
VGSSTISIYNNAFDCRKPSKQQLKLIPTRRREPTKSKEAVSMNILEEGDVFDKEIEEIMKIVSGVET